MGGTAPQSVEVTRVGVHGEPTFTVPKGAPRARSVLVQYEWGTASDQDGGRWGESAVESVLARGAAQVLANV
jgi:hypothetical protein